MAPLIGIFPWGTVNGREQLAHNCGSLVGYKSTPPDREGAPLNPHHTHFIFVDDTSRGSNAWGTEVALRAKLEHTISKTKQV